MLHKVFLKGFFSIHVLIVFIWYEFDFLDMKTLCCVAGSTKEHTVQTFLTSATNSNSCRTPIPTQGKWIIIMALWQILMISRMCTITMEWINDPEFNIDIKIAVTCKSPFLFVTVFVWVDDPYYLQFILSYKSFIFDTLICLIHVIVYMFFLQFEWVFYINGFFGLYYTFVL